MPTIAIVRSHALSHKAAKEAAQRVVDDLRARFALDYAWDGDDVAFERPGVSGRLHVGKDEVALEVKLGLLLGALKSTVEREIHQQLDELFATPDKPAARKPRSTAKAAAAGVHAKAPGGHARPAARGAAATGRKASGRAKG